MLAVALAACEHTKPFTGGWYGPNGPYDTDIPRRLTFDLGADTTPAWLPDESGVLYSFTRLDREDRDRCLGVLPPAGGTRALAICNRSPSGDDTTDIFLSPALSPGGRLAYVRQSIHRQRSTLGLIVVGTLADPTGGPVLRNPPRTFPAGLASTAEQIRWLSDTDFVYLPVQEPAPLDPRRSLAIVRARLQGDTAVYDVLVDTDTATSVAVDESPAVMYYTVRRDSRVFRRDLSTDATALVHDFGAGRFPTAIQVAGPRLTAIVASEVWSVNLSDGNETRIQLNGPALDQALAPSGTRLAAVILRGGNADIWVTDVP